MLDNFYEINNLLHTIIGSVALLGGLIALLTVKGSDKHKLAGKVFAWFIVISALTSFVPIVYKFREVGPVAVIMAVATIYLVITAIIAIRHQHADPLLREKFLPIIPFLLMLLPIRLILRAITTANYEIFIGPLILASLFAYCLITDIAIIRDRQRPREFWLRRHLTRMIFAFGFGVMALVRIGIDFGLTFEMSVVLPLLGAFVLILVFARRPQAV